MYFLTLFSQSLKASREQKLHMYRKLLTCAPQFVSIHHLIFPTLSSRELQAMDTHAFPLAISSYSKLMLLV